MASFNYDTFKKLTTGEGADIIEAVGMSFGMPSCLLNLTSDLLSILPKKIINNLQQTILNGRQLGNTATAQAFESLSLTNGLIEFDTETGTLKFKSDSSWLGMDNDNAQAIGNLGALNNLLTIAAGGYQVYQNLQNIGDQIDAIGDCFDKLETVQSFDGGNAANKQALLPPDSQAELFDENYGATVALLENTAQFVIGCNNSLKAINDVLNARLIDPTLEPRILDSADLDIALSGSDFERFPLFDPGLPTQEDIFRLVYGPPVTQDGQYLLTSDGLYYDAQSGGLNPVLLSISGVVPIGEAWKYNYDPNLGGRGDAISIKSLDAFTNNLFDISIIDDSLGMQANYDADHFLSVLIGQRDKHVFDLSGMLYDYISEFGPDSSIVRNQRQQIISDIANHNHKINRRKKQIEVAMKAPELYGEQAVGRAGPTFALGMVPINDFSYLQELNLVVDLEKQKALVFDQGEVTGIVLPIMPKFVKSSAKPPSIGFSHLKVPTVGKGSILYTASGVKSGSILSLNDQIETNGLFAIYNFLETKVVTPSSTNYFVTNCATSNQYNNAKLLGTNTKTIFKHGLSVPYLEGITKNKSTDTAAASAMGSFVRMPDESQFRELMYNPNGFSIEFWSYVPDILDSELGWASGGPSSLTKVILGCENVGKKPNASAINHLGVESDLDFLANNPGDQFVRGMLMGFTRDRRITQVSSGFSNYNYDNNPGARFGNPGSSLSFFIAPTQARDSSSCSWINKDACNDVPIFHKMKVDLSARGNREDKSFGDVQSQYVLIDITGDPHTNEIKMYADGQLMATSAISDVFGVPAFTPPNLPSFKKNDSFEYSGTTVDGPTTLHEGPRLNTFYTPWIVGGGYTDGMYRHGNFMGGDRGGIQSGYGGFLGSLKFYDRPLTPRQVQKNYNAQQAYFKKINVQLHEFNHLTGEGFNVVFILADDIGLEQLSMYDSINPIEVNIAARPDATPFSDIQDPTNGENWYPYTPALQTFANNGMVFHNAHASPYCTPTRSAVLTGKPAFSSPNYSWGDGTSGLWGHGMGIVPISGKFDKMRGGLHGLGAPYSLYGHDGTYAPLSELVKSADGATSVWDSNNFKILPTLVNEKGYKTYMGGKWHLAQWNQLYTYYEGDDTIGATHFLRSASGTGMSHISSIGQWNNYDAMFHNLNKVPVPGLNEIGDLLNPDASANPEVTSGAGWLAGYPLLDQSMGYVNYFNCRDGDILTVSDSGYTSIVSSLNRTVATYEQGDASSFATNYTFAQASSYFNRAQEPFFMYLPINAAHLPYTLPNTTTTYNEAFYEASNVQARADDALEILPDDITVSAPFVNINAQIENFDYMLSSFLSSIDANKRERTVFIVMGDNGTDRGYMLKRHKYATSAGSLYGTGEIAYKALSGSIFYPQRRGGDLNTSKAYKTSVYESGTKVPLFVSASFITTPSTITDFVDAIDIYATIADITRANEVFVPFTQQFPQKSSGISFLPLLSGAPYHPKHFSFTETFTPIGNSTASAYSVHEADGMIDNNTGTFTGKQGEYVGSNDPLGSDMSIQQMDAIGKKGNPVIPYDRRRGWAIKGSKYNFGHYTVSGANSDAIYGQIIPASAGTWKLVRCTSGHMYDELYHLRNDRDLPVDPFEQNDVLVNYKGVDILETLLSEANQVNRVDDTWMKTKIYYALTRTLYKYLYSREEPNLV